MRIRFILLLSALLIQVSSFGQIAGVFATNAAVSIASDEPYVGAFISDSMVKTSDGTGPPTPITGAAREWNGTALVDLTTDSYNNNGGTIFPQLANQFYTVLGKKSVFINVASSGSSYTPYLDDNNWSTAATLYTDAKTEIAQCLSALGRTTLDYIVVNLGVNDSSDGSLIADVETALKSLFSRLEADYPGIPKLVFVNGSYSTASYQTRTSRQAFIARWHKEMYLLYPDVYLIDQNNYYYGAGEMISNTAHRTQVGQNHAADKIVRWYVNSTYSKAARCIISMQPTDLTTAQKNAIETFVATDVFPKLDMFFPFQNNVSKNHTLLDWAWGGAVYDGGYTFSSSTGISTNGSSTYFRTGFVPNWSPLNATLTDFWFGGYVLTNSTAAATAGSLLGSGTNLLEQTTGSVLFYRVNDGTTNNYATDTKFQNNTFYAAGRTGTSKWLFRNTTQVASATVTATSFSGVPLDGGARNTGSPPGSFLNCTFKYFFAGAVPSDRSAAKTAMDNLITGMQ